MAEVIKDVKQRAITDDLKFKEIQKKYFAEVQKHQMDKQFDSGKGTTEIQKLVISRNILK